MVEFRIVISLASLNCLPHFCAHAVLADCSVSWQSLGAVCWDATWPAPSNSEEVAAFERFVQCDFRCLTPAICNLDWLDSWIIQKHPKVWFATDHAGTNESTDHRWAAINWHKIIFKQKKNFEPLASGKRSVCLSCNPSGRNHIDQWLKIQHHPKCIGSNWLLTCSKLWSDSAEWDPKHFSMTEWFPFVEKPKSTPACSVSLLCHLSVVAWVPKRGKDKTSGTLQSDTLICRPLGLAICWMFDQPTWHICLAGVA